MNILEKLTEELFLFRLGIKPSVYINIEKSYGEKMLKLIKELYDAISCPKSSDAYFSLVDFSEDSGILVSRKKLKEGKFNLGKTKLGLLLGYPKCCIDAFKENSLVSFKRYKNQCKMVGKDPYNIKFIPAKHDFGSIMSKLISHLPCSPECKETKIIAERYKKALESFKVRVRE